MARKTRKTKKEEIKTEVTEVVPETASETTQDLTQPEILEIKDKVDLSDTSVNMEEIKEKQLIEENKKENEVKEVKEVKRKIKKKEENKKSKPVLKEIEATVLPSFDIDEDFFTGERKRHININEIHQTYVIDQLIWSIFFCQKLKE